MRADARHLTTAVVHLDRLSRNMQILQGLAGARPLWPAIKGNAYGHGAEIVARHLDTLGYDTLCVAHAPEAAALCGAGIQATFLILSATLPEHADEIIAHGFEPVVCTAEMLSALDHAAEKAGKNVLIHVMVDTGMGRIGVRPDQVLAFLNLCHDHHMIRVRGLMSHMPRADEADKSFSLAQIKRFREVIDATAGYGIPVRHLANSAALIELPESHFDALRPGIAIYGLRPSHQVTNWRDTGLEPVLDWKTRITFLKEVPADIGLSYGHSYRTPRPSLIATIPAGYGDGLSRRLSNNLDVIVGGIRCPQVGNITMDQSLIDVTALRGRVSLGDDVVLIGQQGAEQITADELADKLGTINYEVVTAISSRVPRVAL